MPEISQRKLETLNDNIEFLRNVVLKLKNDFDLSRMLESENVLNSQLINISNQELTNFLDNRPKTCKVIHQCTALIQQNILELLKTFSEEGYKAALEKIEFLSEKIEPYYENGICEDTQCLKNGVKIISQIKTFLINLESRNLEHSKYLSSYGIQYEFSEGNEEKESNILLALSNENRLKILKNLAKGDSFYTQLERNLGLKGGHFKFHLQKLIDEGFVTYNNEQKLYSITVAGLKSLDFIQQLNKTLYL